MNVAIFNFINGFAGQSSFLNDGLIIFCARWLPWLVILGTFIFLLKHHDGNIKNDLSRYVWRLREVAAFFISAGLAWLVSIILKFIFAVPRPFIALAENIHSLLVYGGTDSFPSGHATFFAALATTVYLFHKRAGIILYICVLLIGLARIAAGLHYPSDILAGYIIGIIVGYGAYHLIIRKKTQQIMNPVRGQIVKNNL